MKKIEFYEGESWTIGLRIIGIAAADIQALEMSMRETNGLDYKKFKRSDGTITQDVNDPQVFRIQFSDTQKPSVGKFQIAVKTAALGIRKTKEPLTYEVLTATSKQPSSNVVSASYNQIFDITITTEVIVSNVFYANLLRARTNYEIAVDNGFVGSETQWLATFSVPRDEAIAAKVAAQASAADALASKNTATTKATEAANSAADALASKNTATTKATEAANSAADALTSKNTATTKATEAANSAADALASKNTATTKATEAAQSALDAASSAANALANAPNIMFVKQSGAPAGVVGKTTVWADSAGSLFMKVDTGTPKQVAVLEASQTWTGVNTFSGNIKSGNYTEFLQGNGARSIYGGAFVLTRNLTNAGTNPHGFDENSTLNASGTVAMNAFGVHSIMTGAFNYDHFNGFQCYPTISSTGTLNNLTDFGGAPTVNATQVATRTGVSVGAANIINGGTILNQYGVRVDGMANATNNWAFFSNSPTKNFFGGPTQINYSAPVAATYPLDVFGPIKASGYSNSTGVVLGGGFATGYGGLMIVGGTPYSRLQSIQEGVGYTDLVLQNQGGNVIVGGTASAGFKFDLTGTARIQRSNQSYLLIETTSGTSDTRINFKDPNREWSFGLNVGGVGAGYMNLYNITSSATVFSVTTDNNLLLGGTANSGYKLDVAGTVRAQTALLVGSPNNSLSTADAIVVNVPGQNNTDTGNIKGYSPASGAYRKFSFVHTNSIVNGSSIDLMFNTSNHSYIDFWVTKYGSHRNNVMRITEEQSLIFQAGGTFTDIPSAIAQFNSSSKGVLLPRQTTTQVNAINSPVAGLLVYNTTLNALCVYDGSVWKKMTVSAM